MSENNGFENNGSGGFSPEDRPAVDQSAFEGENGARPMSGGEPGTGWQSYSAQGPASRAQGDQYSFRMEDYDNISSAAPAVKPRNSTGLKIFAVIISVLLAVTLAALSGLLIWTFNEKDNAGSPEEVDPPSVSDSAELPSAPAVDITLHDRPAPDEEAYVEGVLSTEEIYVKVRPSVVGIVTYAASNPLQASSSGSGIIISEDGYIITNAHVVSGAFGIVVVLDNDEEYEAKLIGIDERTDLAVIKIEENDLTAAEFGNSDELVTGERIIAIGNPTGLNLAGSVTQGIVSGLNRDITLSTEDGSTISMEVIQVDAAINPGNSGGALINKYGQVVGINSSKLASTTIEGIGFAIPINSAKPIADDLIQHGYVRGRVLLGVTYYPISDVLGAMYNYTPGLLIYFVDEEMDVAAKGIKPGDTITKMDGQDVRDTDSVRAVLDGKKPGDTVELTIFRQSVTGKTSTFTVEVELAEDQGQTVEYLQNQQEQQNQQSQQNPFFPYR